MNSTTEYCAPCELPFAAQNQTQVEAESCPVCFNEEGLRKINGCGHLICGVCETNLKRTPGQFKETLGLSVKYIKCPLCRQTEKKTYEQLEAEVAYYNCRTPINRSVPTVLTLDEQLRLAEERVNELIARRDLLIAREPNPELRGVLQTEAARADTSGASEITEETRTAARALVARGGISTVDLDGTPRTQNEMYAVALRSVLGQRQQAAGIDRDTARRFAAAGLAGFQSARPRIRCSGYGLGCDTPAPTQRRCPNHANTACCRRCNICTVCRGRE